jgi:plasmid stability protein
MPTTFTIKQVPDPLANRLRRRAASNHRSLQRELLLILENAAQSPESSSSASARIAEPAAPVYLRTTPTARRRDLGKGKKLSLDQLWQRARRLGAPSASESTDIVRRDRDARHGH